MAEKITPESIRIDVKKIYESLKGKGIQEYHDYALHTHTFKKEFTEAELKEKFGVFFCNGLNGPIKDVALVYCAYEGIISIIPGTDPMRNEHDSYFNIEELNFEDDKEHFENGMIELWHKLLDI